MYILRENDNNVLKVTRTNDFVEAITKLANSNNPTELFEKQGKELKAKRIGYTEKEQE